MQRDDLMSQVSDKLGDRRLVWFGTRGEDVESVSDLPQFYAAYSIIGAYRRRSSVAALSLEDITGERPDLDLFDIDDHLCEDGVIELRETIHRTLSRPSVLFTYRPTTFLSAVSFARHDRCTYLGLFRGFQAAFEHKPFLETAVERLRLPRIRWSYIADIDQLDATRFLDDGPVMLRRSRTTGGVGLFLVEDATRLHELWPEEEEAFVSVAPYESGCIPVNVGAVVWNDGVTVHFASVQLIGISGCTTRPFGFCGNDFGAVEQLSGDELDQIEAAVRLLGEWLHTSGFRGAFGVDFLVKNGVALFTEVNPRFQGSTHASCQLSVERDESCLLLEHLAAFLDIPARQSRPLREQARDSKLAHLVVHQTSSEPRTVDPASLLHEVSAVPGYCRSDVVIGSHVIAAPGATVSRLTVRTRLTDDGFNLVEPWRSAIGSGLADVWPLAFLTRES